MTSAVLARGLTKEKKYFSEGAALRTTPGMALPPQQEFSFVKPRQRLSSLLLCMVALALALSGCELAAVGDSERIANVETIRAGTPSTTPSPTASTTPTITPSATSTVGPSPTATDTPIPSATPLPPTPTPNPALTGFSFCTQQAGAAAGRFSARLADADASGTPAYEQLVLRFELGDGSAPLGASAACLAAGDGATLFDATAPTSYTIRVDLPGWLRDERYSASAITETLSFTDTRTITGARLVPATSDDAGASLLISLSDALPFKLSVERNPTRLVLAVARNSTVVASSDPLRVAAAGARPNLAAPLFYLLDGDLWRLEAGATRGENLTDSPEVETDFATSPDGTTLAFCRAQPGIDPAVADLAVPSALWTIGADGSDARLLAQVGVSCADPAFSRDGANVAFAVDETGAVPVQRAIYTVPVADGQAERATEGVDEWSRIGPQWLADDALVFAATAPDGRSTLFLRNPNGEVLDVGAAQLVRDGLPVYSVLGEPLASPDGSRFAVEAQRVDAPGADLLVLGADGALLEVIGQQTILPPPPTATPARTATPTQTEAANAATPAAGTGTPAAGNSATTSASGTGTPAASTSGTLAATITTTATAARTAATSATVAATGSPAADAATATATATVTATPEAEPEPLEQREGPFWTRPLAWDEQGRLLYLSTLCASEALQDYQLYRWAGAGRSELLVTGQSFGGLGAAASVGEQLVYVVSAQSVGLRGPQATPLGETNIWLWDLAGGSRSSLLEAPRGITALTR